jgi:hypothetical protein
MTFAVVEARLFPNAVRLNSGSSELLCDRMVVQYFLGPLDEVVIYDDEDGKKRVSHIRWSMRLRTGFPSVTASWRALAEPLDSDDESRLLLVYDKLAKASIQG